MKTDKGEAAVTTEGSNVEAMLALGEGVLDLRRLSCNNIHEVARYFGIEAAAGAIVREVVSVFRAYGIHVDSRHLTLIADYMTFDGTYRPFNRVSE